jgi:zinc D-Ala-D-Ala carboxypeptidase
MENISISKHLLLSDLSKSDTATRLGIDNTPNAAQIANAKKVVDKIYEPLCYAFGFRVPINSFFRSIALNKKVGGAPKSQHTEGKAIDLDCDGTDISNYALFRMLKSMGGFDQLIWEYGNEENPAWVHVSYNEGKNRGHVLKISFNNGKRITQNYE